MVKEISRKNRQTKSFGCHLMVSWKFPFTVIRIQEVKKSVLLQRAESSLILAISYRPKFSVLTKVLSYRPDLLYHLPESLSLASDSQIFFFFAFLYFLFSGLIYLICSLSTGKSLGWLSQSVPSGLNKHLFLIILDVGSPRSGWLGTWRENLFPVMSSYSLFLVLVCREKEISCLLLFL